MTKIKIKGGKSRSLLYCLPSDSYYSLLLLMSAVKYMGPAIRKPINKNAIRDGVRNVDISQDPNKIFDFPSNS